MGVRIGTNPIAWSNDNMPEPGGTPLEICLEQTKKAGFVGIEKDEVYTVPGNACVDSESALKPVADAGYAGWLIVEAEQDPAKAYPLAYAEKGYTDLRAVAEKVGFDLTS